MLPRKQLVFNGFYCCSTHTNSETKHYFFFPASFRKLERHDTNEKKNCAQNIFHYVIFEHDAGGAKRAGGSEQPNNQTAEQPNNRSGDSRQSAMYTTCNNNNNISNNNNNNNQGVNLAAAACFIRIASNAIVWAAFEDRDSPLHSHTRSQSQPKAKDTSTSELST